MLEGESAPVKDFDHVFNCEDKVPSWTVINGRIRRARSTGASILLRCQDVRSCWKHFCGKFKKITAGGGVVLNDEGQLLMIHRLGHWDLPKGKVEKGEDVAMCAIREVEEECGVKGLGITSKAVVTYHIHRRNGRKILKISHWYHMRTSYSGRLVPQVEEDIEKVKWVAPKKIAKKLDSTWPSVVEVIMRSDLVSSTEPNQS